jgi:ABC-type glycerol-3-phosphate transport system permease component
MRLHDGPWAVIWPGTVAGLGVLYFTQVFKRMPDELLDLARSEGASEYRVFFTVLPLARPAFIAYGLIHFILAWHEHIIPLVMLNSQEKLTVSLALATLHGDNMRIPEAILMVGSTLTVIPTALLYLLVQKHFRSSLTELTS